MNRAAFLQLRALPGKVIDVNIAFQVEAGSGGNRVFRGVVVENTLDWGIVLNGTYKPIQNSFTFNFVARGVGPICRVDVNGTIHPPAGRTHKHDLVADDDPYRNLQTPLHDRILSGIPTRCLADALRAGQHSAQRPIYRSMNLDCNWVRQILAGDSLVVDCDLMGDDVLRIATRLKYPEGSYIDVFITRKRDLFETIAVSDLGNTAAYLADLHIYPTKSRKRKQLLGFICDSLEVENHDGELTATISGGLEAALPDAIYRVAQASLRVADLCYTQRFPLASIFRDEVEEFLSDSDVNFDTDVTLPGKYGRPVQLDFRVESTPTPSLLLALSTANAAAAHAVANEALRKWYSLVDLKDRYQFMTLFDSRNDAFREDDVERLGSLSIALAFPAEQDLILSALRTRAS